MDSSKPKVHSFAIELTAQCNQRCRYCYNDPQRLARGQSADPQRHLNRVERLLDAFDVDHITLTGGEPFSWPGIWQLLARLRERQRGVQIISNGGLITESLAQQLAPYAVRYVQITLNGPDAASHGEHTGNPADFQRTIDGIRRLQDHGVAVVGCTVLTHRNATAVGEILARFASLQVGQVALSRFSPAGRAIDHAARFLPTLDDVKQAFDAALPLARDGRLTVHSTMPIAPCMMGVQHYAPIGFGSCSIGTEMQEFAVSPLGELRNCPLHRTAIGDVRDIGEPQIDLPALVRHAQVTTYRDNYPEFCEGCLFAKSCGGGCGAAADWLLGTARRRQADPFLWQHIDDDFAARLGRAGESDGPLEEQP